jgi:DNA invertase Pin-like site-specific DNA recombinase
MKLLRIARYVRVSTDDQKKNETIEAQISQIPKEMERLRLLKQHGGEYELFMRNPSVTDPSLREGFFCDDGFNLESLDGDHQIKELLNLIRNEMVDAIFVDTSNRLLRSRKAEIRGHITDLLSEYDVKLFDYSGELSQGAIMEIVSCLNADDKKKIGRRTQNGKIRIAKNYNAPTAGVLGFGYEWDKNIKKWSVVEEEAKWIRWTAHLSAGRPCDDMPEGLAKLLPFHPCGVPDSKIVAACNAHGFSMLPYYERTKQRDRIAKNPLGRMKATWLTSKFKEDRYSGKLTYHFKDINQVGKMRKISNEQKEKVVITRPPILSQELADILKKKRVQRANVFGKGNVHEYLLRTVLRCGHCDTPMSARPAHTPLRPNGKRYLSTYYVCPCNRLDYTTKCSHRRTHNTRKIDPIAWQEVLKYLTDPKFIVENQKTLRSIDTLKAEIAKLEVELSSVKLSLSRNDSEMKNLVTLLRKGLLSESEFLPEKQNILREKSNLESASSRLLKAIETKLSFLRDDEHIDLQKIKEQYDLSEQQCDFKTKVAIVTAVIKQAYVYEDGRLDICFKQIR